MAQKLKGDKLLSLNLKIIWMIILMTAIMTSFNWIQILSHITDLNKGIQKTNMLNNLKILINTIIIIWFKKNIILPPNSIHFKIKTKIQILVRKMKLIEIIWLIRKIVIKLIISIRLLMLQIKWKELKFKSNNLFKIWKRVKIFNLIRKFWKNGVNLRIGNIEVEFKRRPPIIIIEKEKIKNIVLISEIQIIATSLRENNTN